MEDGRSNPFGTRLTEALVDRIYRLAVVSNHSISLESHPSEIYPPILLASSQIRSRLLPLFLSENTFSLRRASLCAYQRNAPVSALRPQNGTTILQARRLLRSPLIPALPANHRAYIRHLHLETFNGSRECVNAAMGRQHRNESDPMRMRALRQKFPARDQQKGHECCAFCNPFVFPNLLALFPRLWSVDINISANRDSDLCWASFCRAIQQRREPVWVKLVGIGQGVLQAEEGLEIQVTLFDEKLSNVWTSVRDLTSDEVKDFVELGFETAGVERVLRVSERMALKLLRLVYWYDFLSFGSPGLGSTMGADDSSIFWDLGARDESWGKETMTAWNWALRQWFKRGAGNGRDYGYVRAMESGGVRDVLSAGRLEAALLEDFERLF